MKIILKADDFWNYGRDKAYERFLLFTTSAGIKVSLGIIGKGFSEASADTVKFLKRNFELIEPFNHSYYHMLNPRVISEFCNTSQTYQTVSIAKTNAVVQARMGVCPRVIGFVANSFDMATVASLATFPELTHVYALKKNDFICALMETGRKIIVINEDVVIERDGAVDAAWFATQMPKMSGEQVVFQLHPGTWSDESFEQFERIIGMLKANGCEFIFPTEL